MSQALPPRAGERDDPGPPLRGLDELVAYFAAGAKPRDQFRVGTEHEKFGFLVGSHAPLSFDGPRGIEAILNAIVAGAAPGEPRWRPVQEQGRTLALLCEDGSNITLEPGGQLELSGAPLRSVHETGAEVNRHLALLRRVCIPLGIGFIGMGFHPLARWDEMATVPKNRYGVLEPYLRRAGSRGLDMMKRTATVQANYDYSDEADMVASFRTALAVSPVVAALFANAAFVEGRPTRGVSERLLCWLDTDRARCGTPATVLAPGFGYEHWAQYVLDVPMLFIRRDGVHHDFSGASFRAFMQHGLGGHRATLRDFADHLTTVFTEVRLKQYLEVRSADCGPWSRICALPALWKGILYDHTARDAAWALMGDPSAQELTDLQRDVAWHGFRARHRAQDVFELAAALVAIASEGLARAALCNAEGEDERRYLRPLVATLNEGVTFGEHLQRLYRDHWGGSLEPLWRELEFYPDPAAPSPVP